MPVKLPKSLRRYIRQRKATLRREFGLASPKEQELLEWARKLREEKLKKVSR